MTDVLLGIDIGTSATKAIAIDLDGRVVASASGEYPLHSARPGWSEQDPQDWWTATANSITSIVRSNPELRVRAIGFSGQMHGSVLIDKKTLDGAGEQSGTLGRSILWNDQRTGEQCARIEDTVGGRRALVERVGNAALTGFTLPKLLWIQEHEPDQWASVAKLLLPKDYVRFRLTGEAATDVGDASGTLLLDVDRRAWSDDLPERFAIAGDILPRVQESCALAGEISSWAEGQTGVARGTPVVCGSGDNMAGAAGAGIVREGLVLATLGTSGVIYAHTLAPRKDLDEQTPGRLHAMCAADGTSETRGGWCVTGCMLSAAGCLQWAHDRLFPSASYDELFGDAGEIAPGAGGLLFLPYLTGERCPYPDPNARGGWIGLTSRHTRGHLIRAILEGVTFAMGQILDLQRSIGVRTDRVRLGGGGAKSELWRQIQADVYGVPVETPEGDEGPAFGAALMAGVGAGVWSSLAEACDATIRVRETREPGDAAQYDQVRAAYAGLYEPLRDSFASLTAIDGSHGR